MGNFESECAKKGLVARDIKNAIKVNFWLFAWAISLALISAFTEYDWYATSWIAFSGIFIHIGLGIGMILAYKRFLTEADELEKKIQLDALAISVGATIVTFSSYSVLQKATNIPELSTAYLIVILSLAYAAGLVIGRMRFK